MPKRYAFTLQKHTFCKSKGHVLQCKTTEFQSENGGLGLYKLCKCNEMLNICSRNACAVNFCLRFVFQIKENSCPDFYFLIARKSAPAGGYVYVSCLAVGLCRAYSRAGSVSGVLPVCTVRFPVIPSVSV